MNNNKKISFYIVMIIFIIITTIMGLYNHGKSIERILFSDKNDTYMDFFNSLMYEDKPYENKVIYPPLANAFYYFASSFVPREVYNQGSFAVRSSQMGRFIIGIYISLSTLLFVYAILKLKKGCLEENILFIIILLLSTPFIYLLERGNLIFLTCSFIMLYLYGYNLDKTLIKHLSFICLSIASAFKIYPAIFGFLLLKEKRWKDAVICIAYGVSIFILPIVFLGGFSKFPLFINNILNATKSEGLSHSRRIQLSIANLFNIIVKYTKIEDIKHFASIATIIVLALGIIVLLFADYKEKWKVMAIPTTLMISIPSFSYIYSMAYIAIPLIYFLDNKEFSRKDKIYLSLFILMLAPLPIKGTGYVESFGLYVMMFMLYKEGMILIIEKFKNIRKPKTNI